MIGAMRRRQVGATLYQWLAILLVVGFGLLLAAKLGPVYITNFSVQSTVKALQNEPELGSKSVLEIRQAVERRFDVNRILIIEAVCRNPKTLPCMKIEKSKAVLKIDANYETRVHIMGNVDAVVMFNDNFIEIPIPGGG